MPDTNPEFGTSPGDIPDPETGITPNQLAEMGWPMTEDPVEDTVEPKRDPA